MLNVTFHGVRGWAPVPGPDRRRYGAHTACVVLEVPKEQPLVLDLGSGLQRWAPAEPVRASVLLSHLHWGHVQGLGRFRALEDHHTRLDVYGPRPDQGPLARVVADALAPPWFRHRLDERPAAVRFHEVHDEDFAVGQAKVVARTVPHGSAVTLGYRVEWEGVSVAYVSDHQAPPDLDRVPPAVLELAAGADLLVHDAQLSAAEWPGRADEGHSTVGYAVLVAREAGARRLSLFHHDPDRDDTELDRLLEVARRSAERLGVEEVVAAYEGLTMSFERA